MADVTTAPDATIRSYREGAGNSELHSQESAWIRDYFSQRLDDIHRMLTERDLRFEQRFAATAEMVEAKEEAYLRQVDQTAEALRIQTHAADENLLSHINAQKESVALALGSLNELRANRAKTVDDTIEAERRERVEVVRGIETTLRALIETNRLRHNDALIGFEKLLDEREKAVIVLKQEQASASQKNADALNIRLADMNKFREQITAERNDYLRKDIFTTALQERDRRLDDRWSSATESNNSAMTQMQRTIDERSSALVTRMDEKAVGGAARSDERLQTLMGLIDEARRERAQLRTDLTALSSRQVYEDKSNDTGRERVAILLSNLIGLAGVITAIITIILTHH